MKILVLYVSHWPKTVHYFQPWNLNILWFLVTLPELYSLNLRINLMINYFLLVIGLVLHTVNFFLTDWQTGRLTDCWTGAQVDGDWQTGGMTNWLTGGLVRGLERRVVDWWTDRLMDPTDWLTDILSDRQTDWATEWKKDGRMEGRKMDRGTDWVPSWHYRKAWNYFGKKKIHIWRQITTQTVQTLSTIGTWHYAISNCVTILAG